MGAATAATYSAVAAGLLVGLVPSAREPALDGFDARALPALPPEIAAVALAALATIAALWLLARLARRFGDRLLLPVGGLQPALAAAGAGAVPGSPVDAVVREFPAASTGWSRADLTILAEEAAEDWFQYLVHLRRHGDEHGSVPESLHALIDELDR